MDKRHLFWGFLSKHEDLVDNPKYGYIPVLVQQFTEETGLKTYVQQASGWIDLYRRGRHPTKRTSPHLIENVQRAVEGKTRLGAERDLFLQWMHKHIEEIRTSHWGIINALVAQFKEDTGHEIGKIRCSQWLADFRRENGLEIEYCANTGYEPKYCGIHVKPALPEVEEKEVLADEEEEQ